MGSDEHVGDEEEIEDTEMRHETEDDPFMYNLYMYCIYEGVDRQSVATSSCLQNVEKVYEEWSRVRVRNMNTTLSLPTISLSSTKTPGWTYRYSLDITLLCRPQPLCKDFPASGLTY